jgi:hypothetical protein
MTTVVSGWICWFAVGQGAPPTGTRRVISPRRDGDKA